ncbi:hypothetical protein CEXT_763371 [Caerostris extrusa]|uniref:Uncharacterized protein n=1 Tax=Caerostris extrusa TaxID=172846 RepID=A0AAV4WAW3_CAEEX|nr:hypothetical protein CEXT_763371 [Caerostris extrusa]
MERTNRSLTVYINYREEHDQSLVKLKKSNNTYGMKILIRSYKGSKFHKTMGGRNKKKAHNLKLKTGKRQPPRQLNTASETQASANYRSASQLLPSQRSAIRNLFKKGLHAKSVSTRSYPLQRFEMFHCFGKYSRKFELLL